MKKLYIKGNYMIADDNGTITKYALSSEYKEENSNFILKSKLFRAILTIAISDAANWDNSEAGGTPHTEASMRTLFESNTGFDSAAGGSAAYVARWDFDPFSAVESLLIRLMGGLTFTANKDSRGVGTYSVRLTGGTLDFAKVQMMIACCQTSGSFIVQTYQSDRVEFRFVDNTGTPADFTGTAIDMSLTKF